MRTLKKLQKEPSFSEIKKALLRNFLYSADSESMQILLNIYKLEEQIDNVFPNYISVKSLRKDILQFLRNKEGKELIASNLTELIHDDINRFELIVYLNGYKRGFRAYDHANDLEVITLRDITFETLYSRNLLYHYENENQDVQLFREEIMRELHHSKGLVGQIMEQLYWYNAKVLKKKIFKLNDHVDRQLYFDIRNGEQEIQVIDNALSYRELLGLNKKLLRFMYKDGIRIYETAYWNGLNDLVLRRYHS